MKCKFELEHVGINTPNPEEAEKLSQLLSLVFNLEPRRGQKSEFAGAYFECMKAPFLGTNGHIAMRTSDLTAAVAKAKVRSAPSLSLLSKSAATYSPVLRTVPSAPSGLTALFGMGRGGTPTL